MPELYHYLQQLVNGLTIGSTYALIAIGYTMVYGIIGMINFAHGEVYMIARTSPSSPLPCWPWPASTACCRSCSSPSRPA